MDEYFATVAITNATVLCVGGITRAETEAAHDDGLEIDGAGYYLFLADESRPDEPIEILGKFFSVTEAARLAELLQTKQIILGGD
jgi:hypothetical protein